MICPRIGLTAAPVSALRTAWAVGMALLAAGCTPPPPPLDVKQAYMVQRRFSVDPNRPCVMEPFDEFPISVIKGAAFVDVWVNDVHTVGRIDTGADGTIITPALAAAAHIQLGDKDRMVGIDGGFTVRHAYAPKIAFGSVLDTNPGDLNVYDFPGSQGVDFGINVGADLLDGLDYDIDFVHQKIRPYRTSNCLTIDPLWRTTSTGLALTRGERNSVATTTGYVDYDHNLSYSHVTIPVVFPGGVVDALFDSGTHHSLMSYAAARAIGLSRSDIHAAPTDKIYGLAGDSEAVAVRRFADIVIGEDEIHDFPINVMPQFDRRDSPMILGMDYMHTHHFWLSYTTDALYIDSGETRALVPPLNHAHRVAGLNRAAYPDTKSDAGASVDAQCWVEADGSLTGCHIVSNSGEKLFGDSVMTWLTNAAHPVMQPAYQDGKPIRETHDWVINFASRGVLKPMATGK